jgi:hypothetical protein
MVSRVRAAVGSFGRRMKYLPSAVFTSGWTWIGNGGSSGFRKADVFWLTPCATGSWIALCLPYRDTPVLAAGAFLPNAFATILNASSVMLPTGLRLGLSMSWEASKDVANHSGSGASWSAEISI